MKAIIMAGGEGTRLKSVTGSLPKPMAPLAGKPMLEHILELLRRNGFREVCLTLRYRPEVIMDWVRDGSRFGLHVCCRVEGRPLGTAGSVRACRDFWQGEDFLVISGDCACDFDLSALVLEHLRVRPAVTMALSAQSSPLQYGTVLTDRRGRVVSFREKPDWERVVSDLVNTGIYVISPQAMEFVPEDTPFDFAGDLFPGLLEMRYEILGLRLPGYWCDIGTPRAYYQCNLDALDGKLRLEQSGNIPQEAAPERSGPSQGVHPESATPEAAGAGRREGLTLRCRGRARLMRELSQTLMEAGAEFSDGLRLREAGGTIRVSPSPTAEAVNLSAEADTPEGERALLEKYRKLIRKLDGAAH